MAEGPVEEAGQFRFEACNKRIRALISGEVVCDSSEALLVWEVAHYPAYYVPSKDVRAVLVPTDKTEHAPARGQAQYFDVLLAGERRKDAAYSFPESPVAELRDYVRLLWGAMDEWLEEDEPIYVHPRSPYTRVDILASSREVRVLLEGIELARSAQPRLLFETGLPTRYYLPLSHLSTELLRPSEHHSRCPYKGTADYFSIEIEGKRYEDYVWIYRSPVLESVKIAGLACFYNEQVDIYVDGIAQARPQTQFS